MPPLAPRPFCSRARIAYRLGLDIPRGCRPFIATAWYAVYRRRPSRHHQRRARRPAQLEQRTKLPPTFYQHCEVA
jgi:hypothetical protein